MTAFNLEGRPGWKAQNGPRYTSLVVVAGRGLGLSSSPLGRTGFLMVMSAAIPESKSGYSGPPLEAWAPEFTQHCFPIFYQRKWGTSPSRFYGRGKNDLVFHQKQTGWHTLPTCTVPKAWWTQRVNNFYRAWRLRASPWGLPKPKFQIWIPTRLSMNSPHVQPCTELLSLLLILIQTLVQAGLTWETTQEDWLLVRKWGESYFIGYPDTHIVILN